MLPFTLSIGQIVNVPDLGSCTVYDVIGDHVKLTRYTDRARHIIPVTDVDQPVGTPIPSYELKGRTSDEQLGDTFWAPENTLTLVKAHDPDPNGFLSTDWERPEAHGYRRSTRNQAATKSWSNF